MRRHLLGNPTRWGIGSVEIQYLQARTGLPNEFHPSPGHGVSSSQPTPPPVERLPEPPLLYATPEVNTLNHSTNQGPSTSRGPPSVHYELYQDGWNNGEGSSSERDSEDETAYVPQLGRSISKLSLDRTSQTKKNGRSGKDKTPQRKIRVLPAKLPMAEEEPRRGGPKPREGTTKHRERWRNRGEQPEVDRIPNNTSQRGWHG